MVLLGLFLNFLPIAATGIAILCTISYFYLKKQYKYWKQFGISHPKPVMLLGNMKELFMVKLTEAELMDKWYKEFPDEKYIGVYNLWKPTLFVRDIDTAKKIMETDFQHFTDHQLFLGNALSDKIFESIFAQQGYKWKTRRQILTRLFTPLKLKEYINGIDSSVQKMLEDIEKCPEEDIELNRTFETHTIRSFCTTMLGIEVDQETSSKLADLADIISHPPIPTVLKVLFYTVSPNLFNYLKCQMFPSDIWNYFSKLTMELINTREMKKIERDDLVGMLMKLKDEGTIHFGKIPFEEVVGHVHTFFTAGHHTTELTMGHVLLQLSLHPDKQEKLREEVDRVLEGSKTITYDQLMKMTYMDNVISETMRIYPLLGILKRTCTQNYKLSENFIVPKGMDIILPAQSFHMDPLLFHKPEEFMPERFSDSEKPFAFMPFGRGPRLCIGFKFAEVAMKLTIARIMSRYTVVTSEKMKRPMIFDPRTVFITNRPVGGMWVKLKKRSDQAAV